MSTNSPRLACRAVIVRDNRLLLVNAYPDGLSDLWCAPGGGVEKGQSLTDNLVREVREETGLEVAVGDMLGVNEFHNPQDGFHQVELFFRAKVAKGELTLDWKDPEKVVTKRRFFSYEESQELRLKPDFLVEMAFSSQSHVRYNGLQRLVR